MNPHQKNKVDISVRSDPSPSHCSSGRSQTDSRSHLVPLRRRAETLPAVRQAAQQERPHPEQAQGAQIFRLGRLRPIQGRQVRRQARRRSGPRTPEPGDHPAPLLAAEQLRFHAERRHQHPGPPAYLESWQQRQPSQRGQHLAKGHERRRGCGGRAGQIRGDSRGRGAEGCANQAIEGLTSRVIGVMVSRRSVLK